MADPLAPTVPERPRAGGDDDAPAPVARPDDRDDTAAPSLIARAPVADPLERALAKAKAAAALFGDAAAVKVGRYRIIERAGSGGMGVVWSAWDPELNRGVALKLASAGDAVARAWARDEGRALAKLSHPNVVPIYDVFEAPEGVFLVMEMVKGKTLRAAATDGATVDELVRAYRQCGDGLAAAHQAGLIHRDFKPDNAILGADQRVRVLDFGLAHAVDDDETPLVAGTPRYMAPEQQRGEALTAAVDQYALCVALREALVERGAVPAWLEPILTRGAAEVAADRYPSMDALVAALALDPRARWRRRALAGGGVVAVGAVVAAFTVGRSRQAEPPCQGSGALIATAWGGAKRTAANTHLATLKVPYAAESVPRITSALDRYASDWTSIHKSACLAHQHGELSTAAYDRRAACLGRRKASLATIGGLVGAAGADALPGLVIAVSALPDLAQCEDDDALLSPVEPPTEAQAPEAAAIGDLIAAVDVERDAGRIEIATRDADAALARARALGYPPLIARALVARGRIKLAALIDDRGAADFGEATRLALSSGDEALAVESYARAVFAIGTGPNVEDATDGLPLVEAITARIGGKDRFLAALLHHNVGSVELALGHRDAARALYESARRDAVGLTGADAIEMTVALQSLMLVSDDPNQQAELGEALVTSRTVTLGNNHPDTLVARILRAATMPACEPGRQAMREPCEALARLHPSMRIGRECAGEIVWRSAVVGDRAIMEEFVAKALHGAVADDPDPAQLRLRAYRMLPHDPAGAIAAVINRTTPAADAPWYSKRGAIDNLIIVALAQRALGKPEAANSALDRAAQLVDSIASAAPVPAGHRRWAIATLRAAH